MSLIESFSNPPDLEFVTICEKNAQLLALHISDDRAKELALYPGLNAASELMRGSWSKENARSAFVEPSDSPKKQLLQAWYEHGLTGILNEITCGRFTVPCMFLFSRPAGLALWLVRWVNSLHGFLLPHLTIPIDDLIEEYSANPFWKNGYVRCFAWHPYVSEFAVATKDDFVHIRSLESSRSLAVERILKHKVQKGVADLAWKPLSSSALAVACQSCILIWTIDPLSLATHLWSSAIQMLSHPGHCPVISLAWCPEEGLLASASPTDNSVMVWNVASGSSFPIRRFGDGGVTFLRWSPDGSKLFSASPSSVFRVWECMTWSSQKWSKLLGRCQNACWSSDSNTLLFSIANEPVVYSLAFHCDSVPNVSLTKTITAAINLTSVDRHTDKGTICIGGPVQEMTWDSNGERLAIAFTGPSAQFVALFQTRLEPTFEVIPVGFICGHPGEFASVIHFKPKFAGGSLLTIVWSSGRIAHIPLYYTPRHEVRQAADAGKSNTVHRMLF